MMKIGEKAPDLKLPDQEDKLRTLQEFAGKWVVLYFYPKDNTSGCTKEACDFTAGLPDFFNLDAIVIGISPDNPASHRKFIEKYSLKLILLSDSDKEVMKQYGAWGIKKNYGKEYEGVIRSTFIISPVGEIKAMWSNVKVRMKRKSGEVKHSDLVKEKLEQLQKV